MAVRKRIVWGQSNPFGDPRLQYLDVLVRRFRRGDRPHGWKGDKVWENRYQDLPVKPAGYYREYYMGTSATSGDLRVVLGRGGEVYVSGNHHEDWRQVLEMPT
jgi:guanyl-specific ribonuclease Sa